jgi:hypothetical protein
MTAVCKFVAIMAIGGRRLFPQDWHRRGGKRRGRVSEQPNVQFVTRLLSRIVLRCLGDGRS